MCKGKFSNESIQDNERAHDAREYFNEQDKLLKALLNVDIQPN